MAPTSASSIPASPQFSQADINKLSFAEFAGQAITLLRAGATRMLEEQNMAPQVEAAICCYFLSSCFIKFENRLNRHHSAYEAPENWTTIEAFEDQQIIIKYGTTRRLLEHAGLFPLELDTYLFTSQNAHMWWDAIVTTAELLRKVKDSEHSVPLAVAFSAALSSLMSKIPNIMWRLPSLSTHLARSRRMATQGKYKVEPDDVEDEDESVVTDETLPNAAHECALFYRSLEAVCAWTTGPKYLLRTPVSRSLIDIHLSVIDLPQTGIPEITASELLSRWSTKTLWSDQVQEEVRRHILGKEGREVLQATDGACHCEAGLIASFLSPGNGPEGPETFKAITSLTIPVAIGVAKKCCPVCRMLANIVKRTTELDLELPGQHSSFFPWVPPHWLPTSILDELEKNLLTVVTSMIVEKKHLLGSRASSPAGSIYTGRETTESVFGQLMDHLIAKEDSS
ncbi:hypothetical protein DFH09DRAFT_542515 [Mycena vulgaris]|nr:hypothetical protein DFH09DRAFT_542515 [Mycena vulgaris]